MTIDTIDAGRLAFERPLIAITYREGTDAAPIMNALAATLQASGLRCCGFLQQDVHRHDRARCDMVLEEIGTRHRLKISEDRGPLARGCRLDTSELMQAVGRVGSMLRASDIVFINKFGKTEAEGGGFRSLIAEAIEQSIPTVIAVPWRNIESWRCFAGELASEHQAEALALVDAADLPLSLGLALSTDGSTARSTAHSSVQPMSNDDRC